MNTGQTANMQYSGSSRAGMELDFGITGKRVAASIATTHVFL